MANTKISALDILTKSAFAPDDYILVARGSTSNARVQATSLFPTLTNLGNGTNYLLNPITSQNTFSQKQLLVSGGILGLANNTYDLTLSINQGSIDLNACNNGTAQFLQTVDLSSNKVTNTLLTTRGGTGLSSFTTKSVFISHPTNANTMQAVQMSGNGELLIGSTSGPVVGTLAAGNNITITKGNGTIEIAATTPASVVTKTGNDIILNSGGLTAGGNIKFSDSTKGLEYLTKNIVSQAGSLSAGVSINAAAGKITLFSAAVAAETQYEFTVTNSAVTAGSLVFVTLVGPGASSEADNAYLHVHVSTISSGSFKIVLSNPYQTHSVDANQRSVQFLVIN